MRNRLTIRILALVVLIPGSIWAQSVIKTQSPVDKSEEKSKPAPDLKGANNPTSEKKELTAVQQSALTILAQLSGQISDIGDHYLRAQMLARIADVMWEFDTPSARKQFDAAFSEIDSIDSGKSSGSNPQQSNRAKLAGLRSEVIGLLARHDPELAKVMAKSLKDSDEGKDDGASRRENSLLKMQVANNVIEQDSKLSVEIAQSGIDSADTIDSVVISRLLALMFAIRRKDEAAADALCSYVLTVVPRDTKNLIKNLDWLAIYIIPSYGAPPLRMNLGLDKEPNLAVKANPELLTLFLSTVQTAIIDQVNGLGDDQNQNSDEFQTKVAYLYNFTQQILSYVDRYMPELSTGFRSLVAQVKNYLSNEWLAKRPQTVSPLSPSDLQDRVDAVKTPQEKDSLYIQLAYQYMNDGEFDEALKVSDKLSSSQSKDRLKSSICYRAALNAITKDDPESAHNYVGGITAIPDNAIAYAQIAKAFWKKKDPAKAEDMLVEGQQQIEKATDWIGKLRGLLALTDSAAMINPDHAFQMLKDIVGEINRGAASKSSSKQSPNSLSNIWALNADGSISTLAQVNFDQSIQILKEIEKKELQTQLVITACSSILAKKNPESKDKNSTAQKID